MEVAHVERCIQRPEILTNEEHFSDGAVASSDNPWSLYPRLAMNVFDA